MASITPINADPYADPAMLAFLRSSGIEQGTAQLAVQNQKAKIARQIAMSVPEFQDNLAQGLRQISGNAEANGMYQSGQRLQDQNDFQVKSARAQNNFQQGLADQSNDLDLQLAQQIAQLRRQSAEQGVDSAQNVALRQAQAGV